MTRRIRAFVLIVSVAALSGFFLLAPHLHPLKARAGARGLVNNGLQHCTQLSPLRRAGRARSDINALALPRCSLG